jgi:hypothetical protein
VSANHVELLSVAAFVAIIAFNCFGYIAALLYARGDVFPLVGRLLMLASAIAALALGWLAYQGLMWLMVR